MISISVAMLDIVHRVDFEHTQSGIRIHGFTVTSPPRYQLRAQFVPIPLHFVISELKDGSLQTNVETAPWVKIFTLDTRFVRRPKTWWERNRLWILHVAVVMGGDCQIAS